MIFIALIESILRYAAFPWANRYKINVKILNITYRRIIKIIMFKPRGHFTEKFHHETSILAIKQLYVISILNIIHKFPTYRNVIFRSYSISFATTRALLVTEKKIDLCQRHIILLELSCTTNYQFISKKKNFN